MNALFLFFLFHLIFCLEGVKFKTASFLEIRPDLFEPVCIFTRPVRECPPVFYTQPLLQRVNWVMNSLLEKVKLLLSFDCGGLMNGTVMKVKDLMTEFVSLTSVDHSIHDGFTGAMLDAISRL